jgi:hypothetical protein
MRVTLGWFAKTVSTGLGLAMILTALAGSGYAGGGFPAPEIDPGSMASALTLLMGGAFLITGRSRKG